MPPMYVSHFCSSRVWTAVAVFAMLTSCNGGGCSKSSSRASLGGVAPQDVPSPEVSPDDSGPVVNDNTEHTVPADSVTVLETTDKTVNTRIVFSLTNDNKADGRYLSEYVLIVRAESESCVRIKMRPSGDFDDTKGAGSDTYDNSDEAACSAKGEEAKPEATPTPTATGTPGPAATPKADAPKANLMFAEYGEVSEGNYGLVSQEICSRKVFKMTGTRADIVGQPKGLETTVSKTGWLIATGPAKKVNVWVDDEYAFACTGTTPVNNVKMNLEFDKGYKTYFDRFTMEHANNVASQVESILTRMTDTYGAISDVDKNERINVFISPEVNRNYFNPRNFEESDNFNAEFIYKPEDLAKYDATVNPRSNEGETIYLWAPDPLSIYTYSTFPTANSLTSNYAKGYAASQIMTLIIANSHLIARKGKPEERWLNQGLSMLAASYYGGNDWPFFYLGMYLSSRPQHLSLTGTSLEDGVFTHEEEMGLRGTFAWYLHARLCDATSVAPCAKIKELIDTDLIGAANVAKVVGLDFKKILENFGLSVGIELMPDPAKIRAGWKDTYPPPAFAIPGLTEINSLPVTVEGAASGAAFVAPEADRTYASPFISKDMLNFQPLLPDNDLDIKLAKHSVTYLLVTGLVEKTSEAFVTLGPNLQVVFVPTGDRDVSKILIHQEKISENAHMDQRPLNLTATQNVLKTYYSVPYYGTSDYAVTKARELRIYGSIDNFTVNQEGTKVELGDSDTYNISVDPCKGITDVPTSDACKAKTHRVIAQVTVQDFAKQLKPVLLATTTDLGLFRGRAALGNPASEFTGWYLPPATLGLTYSDLVCEVNPLISTECANSGFTIASATYLNPQKGCAYNANTRICPDGSLPFPATYDIYTNLRVTYDNFAHSGLMLTDSPFFNNGLIDYATMPIRYGVRSFSSEEISRQFFSYKFSSALTATKYTFLAVDKSAWTSVINKRRARGADNYGPFTDAQIGALYAIKIAVNAVTAPNTSDATVNFQANCVALELDPATCNFAPGGTLDATKRTTLISAWQAFADQRFISCRGTCNFQELYLQQATPTPSVSTYLAYYPAVSGYITYYRINEPNQPGTACTGEQVTTPQSTSCTVYSESVKAVSDIREQINTPTGRLKWDEGAGASGDCFQTVFNDGAWDACIDREAYLEEVDEKHTQMFEWGREKISGERDRAHWIDRAVPKMPFNLDNRKGEILEKPKQIYMISFKVKGDRETPIHFMVGGRGKSQGKYTLRVRVKDSFDFDNP